MGAWTEAAEAYIIRDQADCRPTLTMVDQECLACGGVLYSVDGDEWTVRDSCGATAPDDAA